MLYDELKKEECADLPHVMIGENLKISSHGNRHGGTRLATDLMGKSGAKKDDIDVLARNKPRGRAVSEYKIPRSP